MYHPVPMKESLKHLAPCAVLFISVMAVNIYRTMDKVMVSTIAGVDQNGLYENAEKIIYCLSGLLFVASCHIPGSLASHLIPAHASLPCFPSTPHLPARGICELPPCAQSCTTSTTPLGWGRGRPTMIQEGRWHWCTHQLRG